MIKSSWSTAHEMTFIRGIGSFSESGVNRRNALQGYIESADKRKDWGRMDRHSCVEFAKNRLGAYRD